MRIIKRDASYQELEIQKIQRAILMAFQGQREQVDVMPLVHRVIDRVRGDGDVGVEEVSDAIEGVLVAAGHTGVARSFMRHRMRRAEARARRMRAPEGAISSYIHVSKYARYIDELGRRELYRETVARDEAMHLRRWPELEEEVRTAFGSVYSKKGMPSMRSMQFGGLAIEKNNERMYNCAFMHMSEWDRFKEAFYLLLCGCGVGYSVQYRHVECLSDIQDVENEAVCHYTVRDTIEGWADALGALIESYTTKPCRIEFNYSGIRDEGEPLKTSGGRAPGHLPLKKCLEAVRSIFCGAQGRRLYTLECSDIVCHEADAVLAGGIRRASLLGLFSEDDSAMMYSKARPNYGDGTNSHRAMVNISVVLLRDECKRETFDRALRVAEANFGCPGFYFTENLDYGPNPCGEIGMWPLMGECHCGLVDPNAIGMRCGTCLQDARPRPGVSFCNLTDVNCAVARTENQLLRAVKHMSFIGTLQAAYTEFPYLGEVSEAIVRREALIGVGLAGMWDSPWVFDSELLTRAAEIAVAENRRVATLIGIRPAARVTTIKPGGTGPLEMDGIGSGIHPRWARRYIQRVTANKLEPPAQYFRSINPHMVEETPGGDLKLLFPIECDDDAVTVKGLAALEHLEKVLLVFGSWICSGTADFGSAPGLTHNVSCTITVRPEELDELLEAVWANRECIAAMTFAPYNIDERFRYAPRQAVTSVQDEALWNNIIRLYQPVDWSLFKEAEDSTQLTSEPACAGGKCEIV